MAAVKKTKSKTVVNAAEKKLKADLKKANSEISKLKKDITSKDKMIKSLDTSVAKLHAEQEKQLKANTVKQDEIRVAAAKIAKLVAVPAAPKRKPAKKTARKAAPKKK